MISLQSKGLSSFLWCQIIITITDYIGLPSWLSSKESACNAEATGDVGLIPGLGRSLGGEHGNLLQYSCLENPHRQRSLAGYSPWGLKESDRTEGLTLTILVAELGPTLCDPMDCGLPGSCVQGILQARILEWVATSSSRGSS